MGKWDHAFRLSEAEGVGVGAVVVCVVMCFAIVAVLACWAVPDSMIGMNLFAEAAPVRKW